MAAIGTLNTTHHHMPITPFHFGPGAALHALAPEKVSFLAFCSANVLMDVEPLYFMVTRHPPLHRFFHTWLGATLAAMAVFALFTFALWLSRRWRLPNPLAWQQLGPVQLAVGALCGAYSHIVFDSVMHHDMRPMWPFNNANPLLELVSLPALHWFCLLSAVLGLALLALREVRAAPPG